MVNRGFLGAINRGFWMVNRGLGCQKQGVLDGLQDALGKETKPNQPNKQH